jgi:putative spermidine/putrescine transport system ATP-binding protein
MAPNDQGGPATVGSSLTLDSLVASYGSNLVVDRVSLDVAAGEFLTMLGPSGSGKTTTLNMIAGFVAPDAGQILLDGEPITRLPPHRRDIGMVFQHYALFPHMTVEENLAFPLRRRRVAADERRRRVAETLELVHLGGLGKRLPRQLSGGQQQRVALARALVFGPRLLLMDEPLGALDKKLRDALQVEIKRVHEEVGVTVVYVTHDQEEAMALSDRVAIYDRGRIQQVGRPRDLYEQPASLFVAEFVGESNCLRGAARVDGDLTHVMVGDLTLRAPTNAAVPNGPAVLVLRPERARLQQRYEDVPGEARNVCEGRVERILYLGSSRFATVRLRGGELLRVREQADGFSGVQEGDAAVVSWAVGDGVVLPLPADADSAPAPAAVEEAAPVAAG